MLVALLFASCNLIQEMPQDFVETYGNIAYVEKVDYVGLAEDVENGKPAKVTQTKNFKIIYSIRNDGNFDLSPEFTFEGCQIKNPHVDTEKKRVSLTVPGEELKALADGADFKVKLTLYKASQKVLQSAYELGMRYVRTDEPEISKGTVKISLSLPEGYTLLNVKSKDGGEFEVKKGEDGSYTIVAKGEIPEGKYELELVVKDEKTGEEVTINKEIEVSGGETTGGFTGEPDDKPFEITTETIEDKKKDVVYVRGTDGCYASKYPDAKEGDDVNNSGTLLSPFATIQKAVETVIERNKQDEAANPNSYTIYIDGTLTQTAAPSDNKKGMADFYLLDKNLTLTIKSLSETAQATLNAGGNSRVMYAKLNNGNLELTLENLIITGGNASSANGGGIYFDGSDSKFKMEGCTVKGSEATNGGGIYLNSGTLELNDCTVGGENESDKNDAATGAGIYVADGTNKFEMTGGKISKNKATSVGGGIYITGSKEANISGTTISGNTATTDGGGIYVTGCELTMNGTITNNTAQQGGGVYVADIDGVFTMTGGEISSNHTTTETTSDDDKISGGGIFIFNRAQANISNTKISENTAKYNGGGIHINIGTLNIDSGTTISGNEAKKDGGGVYVSSGTFNMNNGTIGGENGANTAQNGGGVRVDSGASFTMSGGTITENKVTGDNGGGVYLNGGTFTMNDGTISGNNSSFGGGVQINNDGVFTMINGTISENNANGNGTVGGGGGVHIYKGTFNMNGGKISGNKCTINTEGSGGGGVYVHTGQKFTMSGTAKISGNTATKDGGGVYSNNGIFEMTGGTIGGDTTSDKNEAQYGGGVYDYGGTFTMCNGEIINNKGTYGGGGLYLNTGSFKMEGGTFSGNSANIGKGAYIGTASGTFEMKGDANFNKDNDVYLSGSKTIKIADTLNKDYVATITPSAYTENSQVLSGTINQTVCDKFAVTPQTDGTKWKVAPNGSNTAGVLKKDNVDVGGSGGISVTIPGVGSYTFVVKVNDTDIVNENDDLPSGRSVMFEVFEGTDSNGKKLTTDDGVFTIKIQDRGGYELISASEARVTVPSYPFELEAQIYVKVELTSRIVIDKTIPVKIVP